MPIKAVLTTLDGLNETLKALYKQDGDVFRLEIEGAVSEDQVKGLKSALESERDLRRKLELANKAFDGLDATEARRLLEKSKGKTGDDDNMKSAYEQRIKDLAEANDSLKSRIERQAVSTVFQTSEFISKKTSLPPDIAQAYFGNRFKVLDGQVIPTDAAGNPMYSSKNPAQIATAEEAIEIMVAQHPNKDRILLATIPSGGGTGTNPVRTAGTNFKELTPVQRLNAARGVKG